MRNGGLTIFIQTTNKCNLKCDYCFIDNTVSRDISIEKFMYGYNKILDEFDNNLLHISFYGGEPLYDVDLFKSIIANIKAKTIGRKIVFNITTNGTLIDSDAISAIVENKFNVFISLDGKDIDSNMHRFGQNNQLYETAIHNISKLQSYGVTVGIKTTISNVEDLFDTYMFFRRDLKVSSIDFSEVIGKYEYLNDEIKYKKYFEQWIKVIQAELDEFKLCNEFILRKILYLLAIKKFNIRQRNYCGLGENKIAIGLDGDIYPCYRGCDYSSLKIPIEKLSKSTFNAMRTSVNKLPLICRKCKNLDFCNGGCFINKIQFSDESNQPYNYECKRMNFYSELCDYILVEVMPRRTDINWWKLFQLI